MTDDELAMTNSRSHGVREWLGSRSRRSRCDSLALDLNYAIVALFLTAVSTVCLAAESNLDGATPKFLGARSCASSGCHGGAKDNLNQVIAWERNDFHTRAFATLTTARSVRLAEALKITDATQSTRCTTCHAPFFEVPAAQRAEAVRVAKGVSCENCHGPAESWLRTHTRTDLTHDEKVAAGMRDLRNYYVRANTCVACHQNVDPELLKAGHPELIFELDGQCVTEPRHWRERRDDYGPALWLTGQATALREMSWHLAQAKDPSPRAVERWEALRWLLGKTDVTPALPTINNESTERFPSVQRVADEIARAAAQNKWTTARATTVQRRLAQTHSEFDDVQVPAMMQARRAERLVLALDRLAMFLPDGGTPIKKELEALFQAVQSLPDFDARKFAALLRQFEAKLDQASDASIRP